MVWSGKARKLSRLLPSNWVFLQCDIQTRFDNVIHKMPIIIKNTERMARTAKILKIPMIATEQNSKSFGHTYDSIMKEHTSDVKLFEKSTFSMMNDEVLHHFMSFKRDTAVLYGIEAHVCVQQTALDLIEMGMNVHLITDWASSSDAHKRATALKRMFIAGVHMTTLESCIFELMRTSEHIAFRTMLKEVIKDVPNDQFDDC